MKTTTAHGAMNLVRLAAVLPLLLTAARSHAGGAKDILTPASPGPRWTFGASYAPIFGLRTEFSGLGTFGASFPVPSIAPGTDREYDNGFVRVDSSGNLNGETWNWGYDNPAQATGGNQVAMSLSSSNANASVREDDDIAHGIDLFAALDMGEIPLGNLHAFWGFRAGFHYGRVNIGNNRTLSTTTTTLTDTYTLAGSGVLPGAPYAGSFGGPGARLGETPIRDIGAGTALVAGSRELDVHLATLNLGAYLEIPLATKFSLALEGGLSAALAHGSYDFRSATTLTGLGTTTTSGGDSDTKILPGLYLGLTATYAIDSAWALRFSGRYQYLDSFTLEDNGSAATLGFDSAFILSLGVARSF